MTDHSALIYHAWMVITHGGQPCEECALCEQIAAVARVFELEMAAGENK